MPRSRPEYKILIEVRIYDDVSQHVREKKKRKKHAHRGSSDGGGGAGCVVIVIGGT